MDHNSPVYSNYEDLRASELPSVSNSHAVNIMRPEQTSEPEYQQTNVESSSPPEYRGFKMCKNDQIKQIICEKSRRLDKRIAYEWNSML